MVQEGIRTNSRGFETEDLCFRVVTMDWTGEGISVFYLGINIITGRSAGEKIDHGIRPEDINYMYRPLIVKGRKAPMRARYRN